ncbi:hypothetical protein [Ornithinibacillus halophilus]|uniref:Lipoprotein n=1 Tax=Ornithinibacillus halophilus TaxID=930117 RepID=A0A1M5NGD7_9BACI|nr:hypothetical protein [Ornithinibacillus halophilus]SHG88552.1 hypothetical protein SAMN05216225_10796 [Ornithinibacillus halophilus]
MREIKLIFILLLFSFVLIGCQNNNLNLSDDITSIEVYEWGSEELLATIDDKGFIKELVKDLDNARTHSTANLDWAMPDYKLLFKHDTEVLFEIGYCKEEQNFGSGAVGRYWESDKLYEVSTKLNVE